MKLLTYYNEENMETVGVASPDGSTVYPVSAFGITCTSMQQFIETVTPGQLTGIQNCLAGLPSQNISTKNASAQHAQTKGIPYCNIKKAAPIPQPRQDVICLGINYLAHAEESARYKKEAFERDRPYPIYFSKRVNRAVADGGTVCAHTDIVERLDYETELAVIIGKEAKNVSQEEAYDYVFGYTILNDMSARVLQVRHKQWYFGKSLDDFTPMGPWIVTADEIPGKPQLTVRTRINGELRQDSNTDLLIFDIAYVISELSQGMTLYPGTIIAMGTPAGVGMGFEPPKFLKPGDVMECSIEKIGTLTNVISES